MSQNLTPSALDDAWGGGDWGMVAIDFDGNVCAANPGFEKCTDISQSVVLGMSEADFNRALTSARVVERRRVDSGDSSLRAIYYFRLEDYSVSESYTPGKTLVAESLREPLTSIYGFAELLFARNYDELTRRNLLTLMLGQVELMSKLIKEQLEIDKWEMAARAEQI